MATPDEIRSNLRARKANAEGAFETFKLAELVKAVPAMELAVSHAEDWQAPGRTPVAKPKPIVR